MSQEQLPVYDGTEDPTVSGVSLLPSWVKWYLSALTVAIVLLTSSVLTLNEKAESISNPADAVQSLYEQPRALGQLIARVKRSVVQVYCGTSAGTGWAIDLEPPTDPQEIALYEKFPYSVITNEHVIADCERRPNSVSIDVDGVESAAYLYTWDPKRDLALLMVQPKLPGLQVGGRPMPGAWVMTVGNPFELEQAVSIGNVMNIDGIDLVNSAPINHGNSGGPLVNSRGRVVGVTTWFRIALADDPTDTPQDWNVATTIPALCKEIIACGNDPVWTWS